MSSTETQTNIRPQSRAIILAAGKGTRMNSDLPKVLHHFRGQPMVMRAIEAASQACETVTAVIGYGAEAVRQAIPESVSTVVQLEQKGTGHAVACAVENLGESLGATVVILPGDHPLVSPVTLSKLVNEPGAADSVLSIATLTVPHFDGVYQQFSHCGRIVRSDLGEITSIVEYKDATPEQKEIREVNVSYYSFSGDWLRASIGQLASNNAAGEFYLTDLVGLAFAEGKPVISVAIEDFREGMGVNSPEQLATAENA